MTDDQYNAKNAELMRAEQEFTKAKQVHRELESAWGIMAAIENKNFFHLKIELQTKEGRIYQVSDFNLGQPATAPDTKLHGLLRNAVAEYYRALKTEFSKL